MKLCPCGFLGDPTRHCRCSAQRVANYRARVSGPLLDRIDLHVEVPRQPVDVLSAAAREESSKVVRERVVTARRIQQDRQGRVNAALGSADVERLSVMPTAVSLLRQAAKARQLSARSQHKVLRLARTITDLSSGTDVSKAHLAEALSMRCLDR